MAYSEFIKYKNSAAARAIEKCRSGEHITDEEISYGLEVIEEILPALTAFGKEFYIVVAELRKLRNCLKNFQDSRKMG